MTVVNYDPKQQTAFNDPIVRCDSCQALIRREIITQKGCCSKCGNRRFRNVLVIQTDEMKLCEEWGIDSTFLALFEEKEELEPTNPTKCPVPDKVEAPQ